MARNGTNQPGPPRRPPIATREGQRNSATLPTDQAYSAARLTGLAILASLRQKLGDLDRIDGWLRVFGMVNCAPGFVATPAVINGFSDLILELWGPDAGEHARSAVGLAELPFSIAVEIEAEVSITP